MRLVSRYFEPFLSYLYTMASQPPFPNEYLKRQVSESDAKACSVCYKPASTVLLSSNQGDFFYICPSHLKDASFCTPIHPDAYNELLEKRKDIEKQAKDASVKAEANRPYSWNKLVNTINWNKAKPAEAGKDAITPKEDKDKSVTYENLLAELDKLKKELAALDQQISTFSFKNYQLNKDIYRMRINGYIQAQWKIKRQKEMQDPSFFPQAPTGGLL